MNKIEEILGMESAEKMITELKKGHREVCYSELEKEYIPSGHKIYDTALRPDKAVKGADGSLERFERVARIALPLQKIIVERAVAFLFGNPVKMSCMRTDDKTGAAWEAIHRTLTENKVDSLNRRIARTVMRETEVAELWYPVEDNGFWERVGSDERYSFVQNVNPAHRLRVCVFCPSQGDSLFPLYDSFGDMKAFSRQWGIKDERGEHYFFDTYTKDFFLHFEKENSGAWFLKEKNDNPIGKIPVVYARQERSEWADVQCLIERLEKLLSNFADTNDYHASPKIFVTGEIRGFARKGETGAIIEGDANSTAQYLSWQQAPESVRLEISTLLNMIYSTTETPDISFDSVKGLGNVSGVALKMMFMDAHLKVQNKCEMFCEYLERRVNIIKAYMEVLNTAIAPWIKKLEIKQSIEPYMITDMSATVQALNVASGGKAVISQRSAVRLSGMVENADDEYELLLQEKEAENITEGNLNIGV
ncbi:MAG: phage portal protein [Flavobacteriales bacterium]|nr:phage portal protein [Flavobacteriales bacterium]